MKTTLRWTGHQLHLLDPIIIIMVKDYKNIIKPQNVGLETVSDQTV